MRRRTFLTVSGCVVGTAGCLRLDSGDSTATESGTETETPEGPTTATPTDEGAGTEVDAWNQTYGGSAVGWFGWATEASGGGYLAAGNSRASDQPEPDGWLVKTDAEGAVQWEKQYGGDGLHSFLWGTALDGGGYLLVGEADTAWAVAIDGEGTRQWENTYSNYGTIWDIAERTGEGYIAVGQTATSETAYLMALDGTGSFLGESKPALRDDGTSEFLTIADGVTGGYLIGGRKESPETGEFEAWLVKTDAEGSVQWEQTYGEGPVWQVIPADDGYVFASQSAYADSGGGGQLVKTDRDGTVEWERTYGGRELDALYAVVDTGDGYLAAGQTGDSESLENWLVETDADGMLGQEETSGSGALYSLSQTASGAFLAAGGTVITSADTGDGRLLRQGAIEA
jgi:hypothetical protein